MKNKSKAIQLDLQNIANHVWFVPLLLAIVTIVIHHSALNGFFRHDDGWHLGFAACYAPWEYFFVPGITREHSYANLTPWNPLTYDVNLMLFGLNPVGYYAHQIVSIWLVAYMSYFLLRLWVGIGWAIIGAMLFLVGVPTIYIAQELMTGHYLEGLIFACITIYGFVRAIRGDGNHWLALGVLGYILACTCKEIYVPLPVLLFALPESNWKKRLRFVAPFLVVTFLYLYWRAVVLGTVIGGYEDGDTGFSLSKILLTYIKLPTLLFRDNLLGYLALTALATLLFLNTPRRGWLLVIVATSVALLPLAPLTILTPNRYLFAVWWAVALGIASLAGRAGRGYLGRSSCIFLVLLIGVAAIQAGRAEMKSINAVARPLESFYHFTLTGRSNYFLLPPLEISWDYAQFMYNGFLSAAANCGVPGSHPKLLSSVEAIAAIDLNKSHVFQYDINCNCIKEITSTIPELLSTFHPNRESRRLVARVLPPPYRPRRDQPRITDANPEGGLIENINVINDTIEITGWARLRDDEPMQIIAFFVPVLPLKQSLVSFERPDIAEHLQNIQYLGAGFRVTLQFSSLADATYTATHLCAQKLTGGSFAPIKNPANQECSTLFRQQD